MSDYSLIEELVESMACICDAQELLDDNATHEQINNRLNQALQSFESFACELARRMD